MSNIKTGLMYSPLTERVFWGQMNIKTGVKVGREPRDVTSDFISIMLQKFPINTRQIITANGKTEAVVIVLDEDKAKKYEEFAALSKSIGYENVLELLRKKAQEIKP